MTNPADAGKNPDLGPIKQPEGIEAAVFADKEVTSTDVSLMLVRPYQSKPDTAATRAERMTLDIAHSILSRRFERLSKDRRLRRSPRAPHPNNDLFNYLELGSIDVTAADDRWQEAVPVIEQEFRRALGSRLHRSRTRRGEVQPAQRLSAAGETKGHPQVRRHRHRARAVDQRQHGLLRSRDRPRTRHAKRSMPSTSQPATRRSRHSGRHPATTSILTTKEKPENAEKDLAALFEESRGKPVEAPAARALQPFGYTDFGKPGTVASRKEVKDLGITQLVLSNQVRVNLKPTDFEKGKIRLLARIGSGKLTQPKDMPMLDIFATAVFEGGGLGKHSNDDLQQILAGKNVGSIAGHRRGRVHPRRHHHAGGFHHRSSSSCAPPSPIPATARRRSGSSRRPSRCSISSSSTPPPARSRKWKPGSTAATPRFTIAPVEKLSVLHHRRREKVAHSGTHQGLPRTHHRR